MNPRAAINDLLPFQGSPFSRLGTSPEWLIHFYHILFGSNLTYSVSGTGYVTGEDGIRTHAPFRTNGFQDRLVMTTSIPLHFICGFSTVCALFCSVFQCFISSARHILSPLANTVNTFFNFFLIFFIIRKNGVKSMVLAMPQKRFRQDQILRRSNFYIFITARN